MGAEGTQHTLHILVPHLGWPSSQTAQVPFPTLWLRFHATLDIEYPTNIAGKSRPGQEELHNNPSSLSLFPARIGTPARRLFCVAPQRDQCVLVLHARQFGRPMCVFLRRVLSAGPCFTWELSARKSRWIHKAVPSSQPASQIIQAATNTQQLGPTRPSAGLFAPEWTNIGFGWTLHSS